jgi:signal transduction histidine kinase
VQNVEKVENVEKVDDNIVRRLAAHRLLSGAPAEEIRWLADRGTLKRFETGDVLATSSEPLEAMHIVLSGHIAIHVMRDGAITRAMEWHAGDLSGVLPYSRLKSPPGTTIALEPSDVFMLRREHFPALIRECHEVTSVCVHVMLERARKFKLDDYQVDKMAALGRLSAGLTHELNNPASAVARSASALPQSLTAMDRASRELGAARLTPEQTRAIEQLRAFTAAHHVPIYRPPLERADEEEALASWLSDRRIDEEPAEVLADVPLALGALQDIESVFEPATLETVVEYIAAEYGVRRLAADIERSAARISSLIDAVKRMTYMDQAPVPKPVDVVASLKDTMVVLNTKARQKSVDVRLDAPASVAPINGFGGQLNQVWINLIDNAIDAVPSEGHIKVVVRCDQKYLTVSVIDDGPGVSPELQARVFDAFFTTKPVGQGTGLGLDIARRIARRHGGDIELDSRPGQTQFCVRLPKEGPATEPPARRP